LFYFTLTVLRNDLNYLSRLNVTVYVGSFITFEILFTLASVRL